MTSGGALGILGFCRIVQQKETPHRAGAAGRRRKARLSLRIRHWSGDWGSGGGDGCQSETLTDNRFEESQVTDRPSTCGGDWTRYRVSLTQRCVVVVYSARSHDGNQTTITTCHERGELDETTSQIEYQKEEDNER